MIQYFESLLGESLGDQIWANMEHFSLSLIYIEGLSVSYIID